MKGFFIETKIFLSDTFRNWTKDKNLVDEGFSNSKFSKKVVILVQGYSKSVQSIALHLRDRLEKQGFNVFVFNPGSSVNKKIEDTSKELSIFVEKVCKESGVSRVFLVAHSMGGLISLYYLEKLGGHKRVSKIITAGTPFHGTRVAYLALHTTAARQMVPNSNFLRETGKNLHYVDKIISIRSEQDQIIKPKSSPILDGAKNIEIPSAGHTALIRSDVFFNIIKKELK